MIEQDYVYEAVRIGPGCSECGAAIASHGPGSHEGDRWLCQRCVRNREHALNLQPGFYWVRRRFSQEWEPARFKTYGADGAQGEWTLLGEDEGWDYDLDVVGARIP